MKRQRRRKRPEGVTTWGWSEIYLMVFGVFLIAGSVMNLADAVAGTKTCGSFYLRTASGEIINPLEGVNADQPFSTRQTCGACHDYEKITKGFHFQQGWEKISDSFNAEMPWVLSDGMMGKH